VVSAATLQLVNKALSNPAAVVQDLAGSNGQDCFKYTGSCVNLNDNNAMAKACGTGFTVVGWDDNGCGNKNCVSVHSSILFAYSKFCKSRTE
jgi:chitinase